MSENYLIHFGNKNSGRYRRGSGENPHQHDGLGIKGRLKRFHTETAKSNAIRLNDGNIIKRNFVYNRPTYKRAAQISLNNKDYSDKKALTEAKKAAWRNTGLTAVTGVLGGVGAAMAKNSTSTYGQALGTSMLAASAGMTIGTIALNRKERKMARTGQYTKYLESKKK